MRAAERNDAQNNIDLKANLFPLSVLMKYSLYHTRKLTQSIGFGFGPTFLHKGTLPVALSDLEVAFGPTYITEWVTPITNNLRLNLKMTYSHVIENMISRIPLQDFSTWLGLKLDW